MGNNPYHLNKIILPHDPLLAANISGKFFKEVIEQNSLYKKIIEAAKLINAESINPKKDLTNFIKGLVISTPYSKKVYIDLITEESKNKYSDLGFVVNEYMDQNFKNEDKELYDKLKFLSYENKKSEVITKTTRNPEEVKHLIDKTRTCIIDQPFNFFEQVVTDPGTFYLLSEEENTTGYARCYIHQTKENKKVITVDNIMISRGNRQNMATRILEDLTEISDYLNLQIIDQAITSQYLNKNQERVSIFEKANIYYKAGHIPQIERFFPIKFNGEQTYYTIKKSQKK